MTDQPEHQPDNVTEPIEPAPPAADAPSKPSRWERLRPRSRSRLSTVAAAVVAAAAAVLVAVAVFATGFALGSDGGEHHGHGAGGEHSWQADHQNGGGDRHQGHHGQDSEQRG